MRDKKYYFILLLIITFFSGCGETNYILKSETPPILEGFIGFRWTTPMSIVDSEFPERTGATPLAVPDSYNVSSFSNVHFLDESADLCRFHFDYKGLKSVELVFYTNPYTFEDKLIKLKEKLSSVYGKPVELTGRRNPFEPPEFLTKFFWYEKRLKLISLPGYTIKIKAYGFIPHKIILNN